MDTPSPPPPAAPASPAPGATQMQDFLTFRLMITPLIIQILFWILVGLTVLSGLGMVIAGLAGAGIAVAFGGLVYMLIGPIFVRIYCELLILFFRMNETLNQIRDHTRR